MGMYGAAETLFIVNILNYILTLSIKILGIYALVLFIKAMKIYINKNNI